MNVLHETFGANYSNMYMIGWSLGAHVAGYAGEEIKSSGNLIGRITGLDPASLGFTGDGKTRARLDISDASFVDVIHTDIDSGKGIRDPIGHADFYPNYGIAQPGCKGKRMCDHARAPSYFVESILHSCTFYANPCHISNILAQAGCNVTCAGQCVKMGFYAASSTKFPNGTFYLETNDVPQYCLYT
ncbi:lipase member H-like [Ruditapes philippinarum]|uniref:lipase member H-like n=1 Tax=Ruditapes philippinarum TaxID=129788 RepID=UPI00295AE0D8|nr:lipase member H-like [Ruditapes philippinarum]